MVENKKTRKKSIKKTSPKIKKQAVTEIFEVEKNKKEKIITSKGKEEVLTENKGQLENQTKVLRNFIIGFVIILGLIFGFYFYTQAQIHINYKGIEFKATQIGDNKDAILFYETVTLLKSNDGTKDLFGFRLRTNPRALKRISFENLNDFELMKLNAYSYGEGTFDCEGDGVIAMPNLLRVFQKTGMQLVHDENATCDPEERYNYFELKYGDKTEIKEISPSCYEIIIKGNNDKCEILPATEKLMVEIFVKYRDL
jgi:hypothetical protein